MKALKLIHRKNARKKRTVNRLLTLICLFIILFGIGFLLYAPRITHLNELTITLDEYESAYEQLLLRQSYYEMRITRLQDNAYIEMLARSRRMRSLPGEVIFRISPVR